MKRCTRIRHHHPFLAPPLIAHWLRKAAYMFPPLTPSRSFPWFSTAPSRSLSNFPRKLRGNQLIWAQNQPNRQNFAGVPGKPRYTCRFSSILPQILPQTSSQTQGNSRVSRMEHQTPSVFPGNFRKRKVLGTLCFPFCLPEKYMQAKPLSTTHSPSLGCPFYYLFINQAPLF